jgi:penicillin-binding protein 1A
MQPLETATEEKRLQFLQLQPPIDVLEQIRTLANGGLSVNPTPQSPTDNATSPESATQATLPKKEARIYFNDADQLMTPQTAYLMTSLLKGATSEPGATGGKAAALGRPVAGKTGTTSSYFDTWFMGYTPQIVTGVWVGYDSEKSLGVGETGGSTALPIWLEYMKVAHENLPILDFNVPDKIVFSNIDNETGKLANASSKTTVRQAFIEGTEPKAGGNGPSSGSEDKDFFRQDLSE